MRSASGSSGRPLLIAPVTTLSLRENRCRVRQWAASSSDFNGSPRCAAVALSRSEQPVRQRFAMAGRTLRGLRLVGAEAVEAGHPRASSSPVQYPTAAGEASAASSSRTWQASAGAGPGSGSPR